ncbi:MAG TPA: hypothetical protein VNB23_14895 [Ramlibacter sp.]|nr:hypothetical protein [Ramlibacter sp.]
MNPTARSPRLVPAAAVVTVSLAALCAAWMGEGRPQGAAIDAQRPAADAPVRVVKAPAAPSPYRHAVSCRGCAAVKAPEGSL